VNSRARSVLACAAALAIVVPLGWMWQRSLLPSSYSVMDMGYVDAGGGPTGMVHHEHAGTSVRDLIADPKRKSSVRVNLVARRGNVRLASGRVIDGYSLNGRTPGPTIRVLQGAMVEVHLKNANVSDGVALHWHGVDLPNAEDGVAGVTQDAVLPGQTHTYRFVADHAGTYWYHSHQVSHEQVIGGMFGALIVGSPNADGVVDGTTQVDAVAHTYDGIRTLNGREGTLVEQVQGNPLGPVIVRIVNTDNGTMQVWASRGYRVAAVDGRSITGAHITRKRLAIPAGGRADLAIDTPRGEATRLQVGSATALVIKTNPRAATPARPPQPSQELDLLSSGKPTKEALASAKPDRTFTYRIGRRLGFLDGKPGFWWTVNGHLYPDIPMFTVRKGDIVKFHLDNQSGESHPMHLHGHHALVVARDGKRATGAPLWVDSIDVANNQTMDIVFRADNPGIWMDHCHNLAHAAEGLVAHLMYEGVTTPYKVGGKVGNQPE
jgi:FtsP/CotA-like multicopper oxidase with cupredoxin domain